ncbi:MAG: hypothetical protein FWD57_02415 [Polyangiaceae bacterium]|nr:hypothetical protein [Polyangiaceae bacterium]
MKHRPNNWSPNVLGSGKFNGQWVALDNCRYDGSHRPVEADVVDSDEDLAELCGRLHETSRSKCIILHCDSSPAQNDSIAESSRSLSIKLLA